MKLSIVLMNSALVGQFAESPHYVEFKHTVKEEGYTAKVKFNSGSTPALMVGEGTEGEEKILNVNLICPTNGGLTTPFVVQCADDEQRDRVANAVKEAYKAYLDRDTTAKAKVVDLG